MAAFVHKLVDIMSLLFGDWYLFSDTVKISQVHITITDCLTLPCHHNNLPLKLYSTHLHSTWHYEPVLTCLFLMAVASSWAGWVLARPLFKRILLTTCTH